MTTLEQLNTASSSEFVSLLEGTYEHSPWVAELALKQRPFATLAALKFAMLQAVEQSGNESKLKLIRAISSSQLTL